jgi:methionyl-tRNA formyltransferase
MRTILFVNNRVGSALSRWLGERGDEVVGAVVHPPERAKHRDEILEALAGVPLFDAGTLREAATVEALAALEPEIGASIYFGYILKPDVIDLFPRGVVNLHPALLPWNRGANPNVWSIVEGTPAGVTLHYIDARIDTGDIIAQSEVAVSSTDTGASLYRKLEDEGVALFQRTWPELLEGTAERRAQPDGGSFHRARELADLDAIDLDAPTTARELIDVLRARTFPPYPGAWFVRDGRKVYVSVTLEAEDETAD